MTVSATSSRIAHSGNGATTAFAVPFAFYAASDLTVTERIVATGAETTKTLNTDYTVSGGAGATGTVTATTAPPASVQWIIRRQLPITQEIDYTPNDSFPAQSHEEGLDRAAMRDQQLDEELDRAIKFPATDSAALSTELPSSVSRASRYLAFDASGQPIASAGPTGSSAIPVSAFMETVLDDASASAARTTLGLGAAAVANTGTSSGNVPLSENVIGKQTVWVPASAMVPRTTNGAASGTVETSTNKIMLRTLDFDTATQEFAQFAIHMPKGWNEGSVSFQPVWSHASASSFGVVWALEAVGLSDDDAADAAFGTAQTSTDTGGTTSDVYIGPESTAVTIGGSPVENDYVVFQIKRNVADASDTLNVDARLHGIKMFYTTNNGVDG